MAVRLNDLVRTKGGEVTTIAALAERGLISFDKVDNFMGARGKVRVAYFATMPDGGCWEIGRMAYESRTREAAHA